MVAVCMVLCVVLCCVVWRGDGIGVEKKIGREDAYLGRQCVTVFNDSACLLCYSCYSSTRGSSFEIKAGGQPILLCTTYVCAWFLARLAAWTLLELRRILFLGLRDLGRLRTFSHSLHFTYALINLRDRLPDPQLQPQHSSLQYQYGQQTWSPRQPIACCKRHGK
jgi:hypothetical protein